jgi:hypothetical protein
MPPMAPSPPSQQIAHHAGSMTYEIWHARPDGSVLVDISTRSFEDIVDVLNDTFARHRPIDRNHPPTQVASAIASLLGSYAGQIISLSFSTQDLELAHALQTMDRFDVDEILPGSAHVAWQAV